MTREKWLEARRAPLPDGGPPIHASEVAAILGYDHRRDPVHVYLDKIGEGESEETEVMARGRDFEDAIARAYVRQTGRAVRDLGAYEIQQHPAIPWLRATLDRVTWASEQIGDLPGELRGNMKIVECAEIMKLGPRPLQIKLAGGSAEEWAGPEPPLRYQVQVQVEIACYGSSWGALAALTSMYRPLVTFDLERRDSFIEAALPHLEAFRDCVRRRVPPEPKSAAGLEPIKRLYGPPDDDAETPVLDDEALAHANTWEAAKADRATAEDQAKEAEAYLRWRMAGAEWGKLPDGSFLRVAARRDGVTILNRWRPRRRA